MRSSLAYALIFEISVRAFRARSAIATRNMSRLKELGFRFSLAGVYFALLTIAFAEVARIGFDTLGLQTYLTAGPKEARAWTIGKGWKAPQAAGVIHTDFERGFIKAEIVSFDDLIAAGSMAEAKAQGKVRMEGKEYIMQDNPYGIALLWQQGDMVSKTVAFLLLLMSVASWTVIARRSYALWQLRRLQQAGREFWHAQSFAQGQHILASASSRRALSISRLPAEVALTPAGARCSRRARAASLCRPWRCSLRSIPSPGCRYR